MSLQARSCLLSLPAELRDHIFTFAFKSIQYRHEVTHFLAKASKTKAIHIYRYYKTSYYKTNLGAIALLQTCRLLHKECLPLLYANAIVRLTAWCCDVFLLDMLRDLSTEHECLDLGPMESSALVSNTRHVDLEMAFADLAKHILFLRQISRTINGGRPLESLRLRYHHTSIPVIGDGVESHADPLLEATEIFSSKRLVCIRRNDRCNWMVSFNDGRSWTKAIESTEDFKEGKERGEQEYLAFQRTIYKVDGDHWEGGRTD